MKKVLITIAIFFVATEITKANVTNFNVRISDGSSYQTGTSFMDGPITVSSGVSLDFETIIQTKAGSGINTYSINFPTGFIYQSHSNNVAVGTGACNPTGITSLDNLFKFTLPAVDCIYEFYLKYRTISNGNHTVNLLGSGTTTTLLNSIGVNVSGDNTILSAGTLDQNNDGIIDGYLINTAQNTDINSLSGILINGTTPSSFSGSNTSWIISFSGSTTSTSLLPEISGIFGGNIINNADIIEKDTTPPTINNSLATGTYSSSQTITLSNLSESGSIYYSTTGTATTSSTIYTAPININSSLTLSVLVVDMYGNSRLYSYNYSFVCTGTPPVGTSYGVYPTCNIICSSGTWDGSQCVVSSGGGGGGGGGSSTTTPTPDYCPLGDLSGNLYDGKCNSTTTSSGTTTGSGEEISSGTTTGSGESSNIDYQPITPISDLGINTLGKTYFENLDGAVNYIKSIILNSKVINLINLLASRLTFEGIEYYITYDFDFIREYNKAINSLVLFAIKMNDYYNGDTSSQNKTDIINLYKNILKGIEIVKNESLLPRINFIDIENSFAKKDIIYLALKGIIKGFEGNLFKPDNRITRAEFLGMVMKTFEVPVDENITDTEFMDIPSDGAWMIKYIEKAKEYGIKGQEIESKTISNLNIATTIGEKFPKLKILDSMSNDSTVLTIQEILISNGYNIIKTGILDEQTSNSLNNFIKLFTGLYYNTSNLGPLKLNALKSIEIEQEVNTNTKIVKIFRPNDPVSRAEALAILFNIAGIISEEKTQSEFMDIPSDGAWMIKYIEKAKSLGIANGQVIDGELRFRPNDGITRAETTRIITKTLFLGK